MAYSAINNNINKNSMKFLTSLVWEFYIAWYTYFPNDFCSCCSQTYHHHQMAHSLLPCPYRFSEHWSFKNPIFFSKFSSMPYIQYHLLWYTSLNLSDSWNNRPCLYMSRLVFRQFMYQGAFLVFRLGCYFTVWPQMSHGNTGIGLLFAGRERKGCFEVTMGMTCICSN